jgi:lipopolysaccharide/colanic/teichoic acid biosynthesis glycosyltransferase
MYDRATRSGTGRSGVTGEAGFRPRSCQVPTAPGAELTPELVITGSEVTVIPDQTVTLGGRDRGTGPPALSPYVRSWRKRALDLAIGIPLALVVTPLVIVLALLMWASLRCWPFFVQQRVGRDGELFRMVKIRTLPRHAPRYASKYDLDEVVTTRAGRFLRKTHLDELPQLFLVVWGSMSLVGPRPEMAQLMDRFDAQHAALRCAVRPGCTGLWQVSEDASKLISEVPEYDRSYVLHGRASLDLFLLWSTVRCALLSGRSVSFDHGFRSRFGFFV